MGFLNEQSLRMIVEAAQNMYNITSFTFPGIIYSGVISMPFTQSGPLRKMVIAARFNVRVPIGWPELQIIRTANNGTSRSDIAFSTSAMPEPKPTGYLNLYEYDLTTTGFNIQSGDVLSINLSGQIRFCLAYYNNEAFSSIPMVSIVVGDCDSDTDLLTLDTLYCKNYNISQSTEAGSATDLID